MPIEILQPGEADWNEYSSTAGILFLGVDPWWRVRTGGDPSYAQLFRGGAGFLDQSLDGGVTWKSILPATDPPYYDAASGQWDFYSQYAPYPAPDDLDSPPNPSQLVYNSYAGNTANAGEHYVMCTYLSVNAVQSGDCVTGWILYTLDDWQTHDWMYLRTVLGRRYATLTDGSFTELDNTVSQPDGPDGDGYYHGVELAQISATKYVAFWWQGGTTHCHILSISGGAFVEDGSASQASSSTINVPFVYGTDVYFGDVYLDAAPGGINEYKARVRKWDCSGATPSYVGTYTSAVLPGFGTTGYTGQGKTWGITDYGKLAFQYGIADGTSRKWYWLHFDGDVSTFSSVSSPFWDDVTGNDAPDSIETTGVCIDGADQMIVTRQEQVGGSTYDYRAYFFVMDVGVWTIYDDTLIMTDLAVNPATYTRSIHQKGGAIIGTTVNGGYYACDLMSNTVSGHDDNGHPRICSYVKGVLPTVTFYTYGGADGGDGGERTTDRLASQYVSKHRAIQERPLDGLFSAYDRVLQYDTDYPFKTLHYTQERADYLKPLGVGITATTFGRGRVRLDVSTYRIEVAIVTLSSKPKEFVAGHHSPTTMAVTDNGENLWLGAAGWDSAAPTTMEILVDRIVREAGGIIGYTGGGGYHWYSFEDNLSKAEVDAYDRYVALAPWGTDSVIFYGLYQNNQTDPEMIRRYSISGGWDFIWGDIVSYDDPCRAILNINGTLYALMYNAAALKLYKEKGALLGAGEDMEFVSNTPLADSDLGIFALDTGGDNIVTAQGGAALYMVTVAVPPYSAWLNRTYSHINDRGITGLVVLD